jgi:hypothetical protein
MKKTKPASAAGENEKPGQAGTGAKLAMLAYSGRSPGGSKLCGGRGTQRGLSPPWNGGAEEAAHGDDTAERQ